MWKWLQIKRNRVLAMAPFAILLLMSHALMFFIEDHAVVWVVSYSVSALGIGILGGLMCVSDSKAHNNSLTNGVADTSCS